MVVAGVVIGLIAVVIGLIALVLYLKDRKVKKPRYEVRSYNIIRDFEAKTVPLDISYLGKDVGNVTISKVLFWNAGNETIKWEDVASAEPISISVVGGYTILYAKTIGVKNTANKIEEPERRGEASVVVKFEYLDKDDGAVVQLVHTGNSSEDIQVAGTIKGIGKRPESMMRTRQRRKIGIVVTLLILFVGIVAVLVSWNEIWVIQQSAMPYTTTVVRSGFFNGTTEFVPNPNSSPSLAFGIVFLPGAVILLIIIIAGFAWRKYGRERLPSGFPTFEERIVSQSKIGQKPTMHEIFAVESERLDFRLDLWDLFTPDALNAARSGLNSIFPEGSADKPRTLWVRISVPGYQADLTTLAVRLGRTLWVESVGTIHSTKTLAAGQ
jgi:hypothetical protein